MPGARRAPNTRLEMDGRAHGPAHSEGAHK
jgi:hypothetical protein